MSGFGMFGVLAVGRFQSYAEADLPAVSLLSAGSEAQISAHSECMGERGDGESCHPMRACEC
jgi:hypothetical protein